MQKKRILVVDDEVAYSSMFKRLLEQTGFYEVRVENRSTQAASAAREFKPDLIILDVIMPGMDGGEVAAQLQADPLLKKIPFLFATTVISALEDENGVVESAGYTYLAKPFKTQVMLACIEKALAGRAKTTA